MNYVLNRIDGQKKGEAVSGFKRLIPLLAEEKRTLALALIATLISSGAALVAPLLASYAVDTAIVPRDYGRLWMIVGGSLTVYFVWLVTSYLQTKGTGMVGRRVLFRLRNKLFMKIQELPVAFFNQNKAGDLISRINNDTDKLNMFFSQVLVQFLGSFFVLIGTVIFLLSLNIRLGLAALAPAAIAFVLTKLVSGWVKRKNRESLEKIGDMSAEIQESLNNFKVIVAFNRKDYFRESFGRVNENNFKASVGAGFANNVFTPLYGLAANAAQIVTVGYGIILISSDALTIGLLIGYLLYVNNFYTPLRHLAALWASFQQALAALDRISEVLVLESNLEAVQSDERASDAVLEFRNVRFAYPDGEDVLKGISFALERGKTYALVGPTGGGKTTTASLMARLYDPTEGIVSLLGKDIRSYAPGERTDMIGFIPQEPFLFSGTLIDNIFYGNAEYLEMSEEDRLKAVHEAGMGELLKHFSHELSAKIDTNGEAVSLGQRQLVAFMRAVMRKPNILILDEATANIDTVTERVLEEILRKLPPDTTKVIIAHRLNTIEGADEIFFVNGGSIVSAGSFDHAVEMLLHGKRTS